MALMMAALVPAWAAAQTSAGFDEIIVTARKRAEPASQVPLKIDMVTDDYPSIGIVSLQALSERVPALYFESGWGGINSTPTLRGQAASPNGDPNVGVFIDGVYQANPTAMDAGPVDVARVEVVSGPQSSLFGHSTLGGAIHFVSRAPEPVFTSGITVEAGSDSYMGVRGFLGGSLANSALLARIAAGVRSFGGTFETADSGHDLGGGKRASVALQLQTAGQGKFSAAVSARLSDASYGQPPVTSVTWRDYNCGTIESPSGAWSYFCGELPLKDRFVASSGVPDSDARVAQAAARLSWQVGSGMLTSTTSWYRGSTDVYRDFDASAAGELFGVCNRSSSCSGPDARLDRFALVEEIWRQRASVTEWTQELRLSGAPDASWPWSIGIAAWATDDRNEELFGAARGDLTADEAYTAILPREPGVVGPASIVNSALVADVNRQQVARSLDLEDRRTLALFGTLEHRFDERFLGRIEARLTRERRKLDNRRSNFGEGFGTAIPATTFYDLTPRLSLQYFLSAGWSAYATVARGSQSGGINPMPGLPRDEQAYDPEYNWTYELATRYRSREGGLSATLTAYHIDWEDAQVVGYSRAADQLITINTAGIRTNGVELSLTGQPLPAIHAEVHLALTDPQFSSGSDDPGSARFCGLHRGNQTSTFCEIGPSRAGLPVLVPYVDGNVPARVPRRAWRTGLTYTRVAGKALLQGSLGASGQDDVYDRAINGARFGERSLIDAQLALSLDAWKFTFWVQNLADEKYIRFVSSRGQAFFPTTPRPLDALYGEGRRFGLTVSLADD